MKTCQDCGQCCIELGHTMALDEEDVERWINSEEWNWVMDYTLPVPVPLASGEFILYDAWGDPNDGEELDACPFLEHDDEGWWCLIYPVRPNACRQYPHGRLTQLCIKAGVPLSAIVQESQPDERPSDTSRGHRPNSEPEGS